MAGSGDLTGAVLQDIDLRDHSAALLEAKLRGAVFLGCTLEPALTHAAVEAGALVFPPLPGLPFDPYRSRLYTVEALYDHFDPARPESYAECLDARVYVYWKAAGGAAPASIMDTLRVKGFTRQFAPSARCSGEDPQSQPVAVWRA